MTIRIFIGYDEREAVAYHVLSHSIMKRSTMPVQIIPIYRGNLGGIFDRERGKNESTDFSISRFMVPCLSDYEGWSIFMDSDMLCLGDIAELARFMTLSTRWTQAVHVVKHGKLQEAGIKFLGEKQLPYEKKNWSSVMLFNNALCRNLTQEYVASATGLELHQFKWTTDDRIGSLPKDWNHLVGVQDENAKAKLVHYTLGIPCFRGYEHCEYSREWFKELEDMTHYETKNDSGRTGSASGEQENRGGSSESAGRVGVTGNPEKDSPEREGRPAVADVSEVRVLRARAEVPYGELQG